ncbi:alcohol dehydrogenase catalytic domain-containing protein [Frankia sp. AgB1.9]|uniref:zinc-dependent alcohol dehydrogenase n=1 Tax=unclassified Frankia TaxID=2632575 RepID=UPI0019315BCA|nr:MULTISPECIES: zinc-binding dehydrogenase [unclassified Frankia]MBL7489464.1 alcohol dehydrogenase catalytic domain-containing protein [Frankia sp. AgW1.1]MBL7554062.1 alcohol dehydrogenase catalytic domain-containing protein [Frankia sp. AgB1.9]MBL7624392.1 alcohol dehydrogenase catalytic domain-containing protein [Frankia sp. AgB1.8]
MKAVRAAEGGVQVVDLEEPPGTGELLQIRSASICSSDLMYISYGCRFILGHELAGVDEAGDAYVVEALYGCMDCDQCRSGRYNRCPTHGERGLGFSIDGGMAEQFRAPAGRLVPLPAGLDVRDASLVEPAAVSWHALRLAGTGVQTRVAVVGAGALGLLAAAGAQGQGAEDVAIEARHPHQIEAAARLGATIGTDGRYDVVVEAAGSPASLARAIDLVAPGGTIVVVGVFMEKIEIDWPSLFLREARLIPSLGYCAHAGGREMEDAAAMLAANPEISRTLISHRFPLKDAEEAFQVASDRRSGAIRVVLEP